MTEGPRVLRLSVSPALFRLITECILIESNEARRLETVDRLATNLLRAGPAISADEAGQLLDHLTAMPSAGPIALEVSLGGRESDVFEAYRSGLEHVLEQPTSDADAFSALLFAFLVDHRVRTAAAAIAESAAAAPDLGHDTDPRVLPLRR